VRLSTVLLALLAGAAAGAAVGLLIWRRADTELRANFQSGGAQLATALQAGRGQVTALAAQGEAQVAAAVGTAIQQNVIPAVRTQVTAQLNAAGITPVLVADLKQAIALARTAGVIR